MAITISDPEKQTKIENSSLSNLERESAQLRWRSLAEQFRNDLSRHDLAGAEIRLLEALCKHSHLLYRPTARYARLNQLAKAAGIDASNISRVFEGLLCSTEIHKREQSKQIVIEVKGEDARAIEFKLQTDCALWRNVKELSTRESYDSNERDIRSFSFESNKYMFLPGLEPPKESIAEAAADCAREQMLTRQNDESRTAELALDPKRLRQNDEVALMSTNATNATKQYCIGEKSFRSKKFSALEQSHWDRLLDEVTKRGGKLYRNPIDKNWWISMVRRNWPVLDVLIDDLINRARAQNLEPITNPAGWLRKRWDEKGRPGDWH